MWVENDGFSRRLMSSAEKPQTNIKAYIITKSLINRLIALCLEVNAVIFFTLENKKSKNDKTKEQAYGII